MVIYKKPAESWQSTGFIAVQTYAESVVDYLDIASSVFHDYESAAHFEREINTLFRQRMGEREGILTPSEVGIFRRINLLLTALRRLESLDKAVKYLQDPRISVAFAISRFGYRKTVHPPLRIYHDNCTDLEG